MQLVSITQDSVTTPTASSSARCSTSSTSISRARTPSTSIAPCAKMPARASGTARPPFGYRVEVAERRGDKDKKVLVVDEDEARDRAQDLRDGGRRGRPSGRRQGDRVAPQRARHLAPGPRFSTGSIHDILTSTTYFGSHYFNRRDSRNGTPRPPSQWVALDVPAIIEEQTFNAVRALMQSRDPKRMPPRVANGPTLLAGVVRCGYCGAAMIQNTGKGGDYRYYCCSRKLKEGLTACRGRSDADGPARRHRHRRGREACPGASAPRRNAPSLCSRRVGARGCRTATACPSCRQSIEAEAAHCAPSRSRRAGTDGRRGPRPARTPDRPQGAPRRGWPRRRPTYSVASLPASPRSRGRRSTGWPALRDKLYHGPAGAAASLCSACHGRSDVSDEKSASAARKPSWPAAWPPRKFLPRPRFSLLFGTGAPFRIKLRTLTLLKFPYKFFRWPATATPLSAADHASCDPGERSCGGRDRSEESKRAWSAAAPDARAGPSRRSLVQTAPGTARRAG